MPEPAGHRGTPGGRLREEGARQPRARSRRQSPARWEGGRGVGGRRTAELNSALGDREEDTEVQVHTQSLGRR